MKLVQKNLAVTEINDRLANTPTVVLINGERDCVCEREWRHYRSDDDLELAVAEAMGGEEKGVGGEALALQAAGSAGGGHADSVRNAPGVARSHGRSCAVRVTTVVVDPTVAQPKSRDRPVWAAHSSP